MNSFHELQDALREYVSGRGWIAPTNVKNLSIGLAAEAGKLLADIQWLDEDDLDNLSLAQRNALTGHLAKLTIMLARLSDVLDIDSLESAHELHRTAPIQLGPDIRPVASPPKPDDSETSPNGERTEDPEGDTNSNSIDDSQETNDWSMRALVESDFSHTKLRHAKFVQADLQRSTFRYSDLTNATFVGANLRSADFTGAHLFDANFTNADLTDADLTGAYIDGANFLGARQSGAKLPKRTSTAPPADRVTETPNSVEHVEESGEDKSPAPEDSLASEVESDGQDDHPRAGPDYRGQRLVNNNFSYRKLQDANFAGADLRQSVFRNSDLTGATFKGATLQMANFQGARLVNSDFTNADLRGANLSRADTSGATFDGARLDDAKLNANASAQRPEPRRANQDERKAKKPKKKSSQKRAHSPRPSAGRYRDLPTISSCAACGRPIDAVSGKCGCT